MIRTFRMESAVTETVRQMFRWHLKTYQFVLQIAVAGRMLQIERHQFAAHILHYRISTTAIHFLFYLNKFKISSPLYN